MVSYNSQNLKNILPKTKTVTHFWITVFKSSKMYEYR